jgi:hypothetical protein
MGQTESFTMRTIISKILSRHSLAFWLTGTWFCFSILFSSYILHRQSTVTDAYIMYFLILLGLLMIILHGCIGIYLWLNKLKGRTLHFILSLATLPVLFCLIIFWGSSICGFDLRGEDNCPSAQEESNF